jgi:hypothetical protein
MKRLLAATVAVIPLGLVGLAAFAQGRPAPASTAASTAKLTICHKTAADTFRRITVSSRAVTFSSSRSGRLLRAHLLHTGDAIVVGTAACPSASATPTATGTPPARITICHRTGSTTNPFRRITVSSRAVTNPSSRSGRVLRGHLRHVGDLILPGAPACPAPAGGQGQAVRLTATLHPVEGASGSGSATVTIRLGQRELCFTLTVSGLTNVTAAHIHRLSTSAIVVPLTAPTSGTSNGCVTVERALLQEILANPGAFYVNVHTSAFPNGQIRGNLTG